jgi:hypothetical protein
MATCRQSILSLGYVILLLPHMKAGSDVLMQKNITKNKMTSELKKMEDEYHEIKERVSSMDIKRFETNLKKRVI